MEYPPFPRPPSGAVPSTPVPPAWQPPSPQAGYPATVARTNRAAVAALVLGMVGVLPLLLFVISVPAILFDVLPFFLIVTSVPAIIFGVRGRRHVAASNGRETGRGLATAGLVLGIVGVVLLALVVAFVAFLIMSAIDCRGTHGNCFGG